MQAMRLSTVGGDSGMPVSPFSPGGFHGSDTSPALHRGTRGAGNPFAMGDRRLLPPESGPSPTTFMEYAARRDPQKVLAEMMPGSLESVPGSSSGFAMFAGWDPVTRMPIPQSRGVGSSGFSSAMPASSASLVEHQEMSFMLHAAGSTQRAGAPGSMEPPESGGAFMPAPPSQEAFPRMHAVRGTVQEKVMLAEAFASGYPADVPQGVGGRPRRWRRPAFGGRPVAEGMQDVSDASSSEGGSARSVHSAAGDAADGAAAQGATGDSSLSGSSMLAAESLEALPAMAAGVARPASGSGSASVDDFTASAGLGSRPTSATVTDAGAPTGSTDDGPLSLQLRLGASSTQAQASEDSARAAQEGPPQEGPVASFMLDSLPTDSHSELTMALLPDGGGGSARGPGGASSSGFGSPLRNGGSSAAANALKRDSSDAAAGVAAAAAGTGAAAAAGTGGGAYKLLLQPLPESFSSIPEAWSSHRSSGGGSPRTSLLNSTGGMGASMAGHAAMSSGGAGGVEVLMTHDTMSTVQTSASGAEAQPTWQQIARRQSYSPEQARPSPWRPALCIACTRRIVSRPPVPRAASAKQYHVAACSTALPDEQAPRLRRRPAANMAAVYHTHPSVHNLGCCMRNRFHGQSSVS